MPAQSSKQQRFMGSELARALRNRKTQTGMSVNKLREMARKPEGGYKAKQPEAHTLAVRG